MSDPNPTPTDKDLDVVRKRIEEKRAALLQQKRDEAERVAAAERSRVMKKLLEEEERLDARMGVAESSGAPEPEAAKAGPTKSKKSNIEPEADK